MKRINRRTFLGAAGAALACPALAQQIGAWQPSRPIQLIVGYAPGGGSDIIARTIAEACAPIIPVPMVVVNRPGAGGALAAEFVARAAPDGHTLVMHGGSESTSLPAFRDVPYDPKKSFRAVIRLTRNGHVLSCKGGPNPTYADFAAAMAAAKANPGGVAHGSAGIGTLSHSIFILMERAVGVEFLHVPYNGGGPALQALLQGLTQLNINATDELGDQVTSGALKALAVASEARAKAYPDVPTLRELGYDIVADNMKGWVGPAGMTDEMTTYLHDRFRQGMQTPTWQRFMERVGEADGYANGPDFQLSMDRLLDSIRAAIKRT
ncbi:Bug family tripartite tricarboxylate transporter substrate binding protein [Pararoseomonas indoligenes]|uniref:Tripartite tricarboxylate transporter substrate binding protein n=1 Tax=Roseomonas indoligenes TaxID=2820811 RepID=A0A940S7W1_9PROT|nr:tripartite tricarboxylate transporter substrate binding protein [Pararoseomonas indoligenes]MBP0493482.1 tripartite tricarboxylate transporter substrate binding protein [Pararoseomonas indoligenes]